MDTFPSGSTVSSEENKPIKREEIFYFIREKDLFKVSVTACTKEVLNYVLSRYSITDLNEDEENICKTYTKTFISLLFKKWKASKHTLKVFLKAESSWIEHEFKIPRLQSKKQKNPMPGRPKKLFQESGIQTKKAKIQQLKNRSSEELLLATQCSLRQEGKRSMAEVIKNVATSSPRSLKRIKKHSKTKPIKAKPVKAIVPYTAEEALALMTELKLTKHQYRHLQQSAKQHNANIYPTYDSILKIKKQCYPHSTSIMITETLCEIKLQFLLDLTVQRISNAQNEIFDLHCKDEDTLECVWKWGCDGSGGHSRYKQKFMENSSASDSDILMTCIVPLEIKKQTATECATLWTNLRCSAPRYCRPVRIAFAKESMDVVIEEFNRMEAEIRALKTTDLFVNNKSIHVTHVLLKTMVDGKTCNAVMRNRASAVCYICKASPKDMNDIDKCLKKPCDPNAFAFGLSTLHAQIRFFEALIHMSYKLENKSWQARGEEAKKSVECRKRIIQDKLRSELGLLVDIPKRGGGNTNDGNTARKFFKDPEKSARIIGIDQELVERFSIILKTLSAGLNIDSGKFRKYCLDTAKLYTEKYPWYKMPVSIHKILLHGADVIENLPIPICQLSEDVLEAHQKDYKRYREGFSRKMSRIDTNTDVLNNLLISSDPVITNLQNLPLKKCEPLPSQVLELLLE